MKRFLAFTLVLVMSVSLFSACGSDSGNTGAADTGSASGQTAVKDTQGNTGEPTNLKVWLRKQEIMQPFQEMVDKYQESNPNVKITLERPGGDKYYATIKVLFASGDTPDIFSITAGTVLKKYYESGLVGDLTAENYNVLDSAKASCTVDGKVAALPMDLAGIGVIYNKKVFSDAGITDLPKTVTQLKEVCDKLKAKGVSPFGVAFKDTWTLAQMFSVGHTSTVDINQFVTDMNAGKTSFKNEKMDKVFETFDMIAANSNEKPLDSDYNNQCTLFAQGKVGMMVQGLWSLANVTKIDPNIETGMFALPLSENPDEARMMGDVDLIFCLYAKSTHADESKKFMKWLTTTEATDMFRDKCKLISTVNGATAPSSLGASAEDLLKYFESNKVYRWGFLEWPDGYNLDMATVLQSYFAKQTSKEDFYKFIDKMWQDYINK